jgi:hypothetical protein
MTGTEITTDATERAGTMTGTEIDIGVEMMTMATGAPAQTGGEALGAHIPAVPCR